MVEITLYSMRSCALSRNVSTQDTDISAMHHTMLDEVTIVTALAGTR